MKTIIQTFPPAPPTVLAFLGEPGQGYGSATGSLHTRRTLANTQHSSSFPPSLCLQPCYISSNKATFLQSWDTHPRSKLESNFKTICTQNHYKCLSVLSSLSHSVMAASQKMVFWVKNHSKAGNYTYLHYIL